MSNEIAEENKEKRENHTDMNPHAFNIFMLVASVFKCMSVCVCVCVFVGETERMRE